MAAAGTRDIGTGPATHRVSVLGNRLEESASTFLGQDLQRERHLGAAVRARSSTGRARAQFHVEFLNAFNHPIFNNPNTDPTSSNFGKVTSQANLPRDIQLAARTVF